VEFGHSIIIPWNPHGIVEIIPYGIHMDIPSSHVEFGHSITIPYGIQVEWRSQNEWDLSQNIFHMKWWIPCGIRGESKDLLPLRVRARVGKNQLALAQPSPWTV